MKELERLVAKLQEAGQRKHRDSYHITRCQKDFFGGDIRACDCGAAEHNAAVDSAADELMKELKLLILSAPGFDEENFETNYKQWWDDNFRTLRVSLPDKEYEDLVQQVLKRRVT
ncbi:MAG: hypothetical protein M0R32_09185 [Candidatus Cloacimonetes bacterium]|jgi:hypothetical protein|nr:hypothetical protein [Candidatus Cloacimonadota bacterium]